MKEICKIIIENNNGNIPDEIDELIKLPGVGRKTANLVVILGFNKPGICVDTHVHRISNRIGWVQTKTPEETEFALRKLLPLEYWRTINDYLVSYGQTVCTPMSPHCSVCKLNNICQRNGVDKSR
jgi:endonuclease-3